MRLHGKNFVELSVSSGWTTVATTGGRTLSSGREVETILLSRLAHLIELPQDQARQRQVEQAMQPARHQMIAAGLLRDAGSRRLQSGA